MLQLEKVNFFETVCHAIHFFRLAAKINYLSEFKLNYSVKNPFD